MQSKITAHSIYTCTECFLRLHKMKRRKKIPHTHTITWWQEGWKRDEKHTNREKKIITNTSIEKDTKKCEPKTGNTFFLFFICCFRSLFGFFKSLCRAFDICFLWFRFGSIGYFYFFAIRISHIWWFDQNYVLNFDNFFLISLHSVISIH